MKRFLIIISLCCASYVWGAIPAGYYSTIDGKSGDAILIALYNKISSHTNVGYDGLYNVYPTSDVTADGKVWDMYSTCSWTHGTKKCGSYKKVCDCYNREHSIPASWFKDASPMYSDAFHVVPTDGYVNNQRGNHPFGECSGGKYLSSQATGRLGESTFSGMSGTVFEPADEYKGDFARNYFYMLTCYRNKNFTQASEGQKVFTYSNGVAGLTSYGLALFLKWHRQDPVSQKEIDRNNAIYDKQENRNPYIDHPGLVEYIWGAHKGEKLNLAELDDNEEVYIPDTTTTQPPTPEKFTVLDVTDVHATSATLNWTDAGVDDYIVDVYEKNVSEGAEPVVILDDLGGKKANVSGYTNADELDDAIRLGSSKATGSITYKNLNVSSGATVYVTAKTYNTDQATIKVSIGSTTASFKLSSDYVTYTLNVPEGETGTSLTIESTESKARAYINKVQVITGLVLPALSRVSGYPKHVGNVLSHEVTGLTEMVQYFYTVQPVGMEVSEERTFLTEAGWTGTEFVNFPTVEVRATDNGILINGLPEGACAHVYNSLGQEISSTYTNDLVCITTKGIYLVLVSQNDRSQTFKVKK